MAQNAVCFLFGEFQDDFLKFVDVGRHHRGTKLNDIWFVELKGLKTLWKSYQGFKIDVFFGLKFPLSISCVSIRLFINSRALHKLDLTSIGICTVACTVEADQRIYM